MCLESERGTYENCIASSCSFFTPRGIFTRLLLHVYTATINSSGVRYCKVNRHFPMKLLFVQNVLLKLEYLKKMSDKCHDLFLISNIWIVHILTNRLSWKWSLQLNLHILARHLFGILELPVVEIYEGVEKQQITKNFFTIPINV